MTCINGITKEKGDSNIWKCNYKVNLMGVTQVKKNPHFMLKH